MRSLFAQIDLSWPKTCIFVRRQRTFPHTIQEQHKLIDWVRSIKDRVKGIERMLEEDKGSADFMQLIVSARGAINGLMGEILEDHVPMHIGAEGWHRSIETKTHPS